MHPVLQSCFLFEGVPAQDTAALTAALPPEVPFRKGQPVCLPAQRGVMLLLCGRARAVYRDVDGGEHLLKFLQPGQIFGAVTLFEQPTHTSFVIAEQNGAAQFIPEAVLVDLW